MIDVWTHDSVGLGEDGPTHQPVEHYAALRAIPNLWFVRPGDANEAAAAWAMAVGDASGADGTGGTGADPPEAADARPALPSSPARACGAAATSSAGVRRGRRRAATAILIATGSELQLAVGAAERLEAEGTPARVVSLPCWERFEAQDAAYREAVLPRAVRQRVTIEAGVSPRLGALCGRRRRDHRSRSFRGIGAGGQRSSSSSASRSIALPTSPAGSSGARSAASSRHWLGPRVMRSLADALVIATASMATTDRTDDGSRLASGRRPGRDRRRSAADASRVRGRPRGCGPQGRAPPATGRRRTRPRAHRPRRRRLRPRATTTRTSPAASAARSATARPSGASSICGSGVGASVAANKVRGVRAAVCHDTYSAHQGVEHDDMNVLTFGARVIGIETAVECAVAFLGARFSGEPRHARRLGKVLAIEAEGG